MKPSDGVKKFGGKGGDKLSNIQAAKGELGKTREQLAEEKKIAMSIRVQPLHLDGMQASQLKAKAEQMWTMILKLETEKYDMEERMKRQDYDLKELKERQKMQLRHKTTKRGLEPEALTGKHPPKIQTASKFERRTDRRTYDDKKKLFEGGLNVAEKDEMEKKNGPITYHSLKPAPVLDCPSGSVSDQAGREPEMIPPMREKDEMEKKWSDNISFFEAR